MKDFSITRFAAFWAGIRALVGGRIELNVGTLSSVYNEFGEN